MAGSPAPPPRICMVATVPVAFTAFMAPHVRELAKSCPVTLVTTRDPRSWTDGGEAMAALCREPGVTFVPMTIPRSVSAANDLKALIALWRLFRRERYDLVHTITPKAGLLAMLAAVAAGVPLRAHWYAGQVWATRRGLGRLVLKTCDRIVARCATHLLADSASQRTFLDDEGVARAADVTVLGSGSVCGVDMTRFRPDPAARAAVRAQHGIPGDAIVALYLGRLSREKGLPELAAAGARASAHCPRLHLLIVGPDDEGRMRDHLRSALAGARATILDHTDTPETFMAAADIFLQPSHREGFGATVIEAAACGVPTIGSRIYGLTDAVVDGETGILVDARNAEALAAALIRLTEDEDLRAAMGRAARARVDREFREDRLVGELIDYYRRLGLCVATPSAALHSPGARLC